MIRGFQRTYPLEPARPGSMQWGPTFASGLIAGVILLVVPRGSPWSSLTLFNPAIMGRAVSAGEMPLLLICLLHLAISFMYGLVISRLVTRLTQLRAIIVGGIVGLALYLVNLAVVSIGWPQTLVNEVTVAFTHAVFGLLAAGAYRGLLRRKPLPQPSLP